MSVGTTIVAPATPHGTSAIGVVRMSGAAAVPMLERWAAAPSGGWVPGRATLRILRDEEGRPMDQALVLVFRAPHSYTGEDVVELHLHGNPVIISRVAAAAQAAGARLADPGGFTRRAILNGKLGLPEAESLAELIEAASPLGAAQALGRLRGDLRRWAESVRAELIDALAQLEAQIDFPEEPLETEAVQAGVARLRALADRLEAQATAAARARIWTAGAKVVLIGAPNAGKSTLLNRLVGEERAIVSPWAGTTRDFLSAGATLAGVPVQLIDTAGIRAGGEAVEREGIRRSAERAREADLVIWVQAPDAPADPALRELVEELDPGRVLVVANKRDLAAGGEAAASAPEGGGALALSAAHDPDLEPLLTAIAARLAPPAEDPVLGTMRQEAACREAAGLLTAAAGQLAGGHPPEIAAEEVRAATKAVARLLGDVDSEDVLDRVFSAFCIGK